MVGRKIKQRIALTALLAVLLSGCSSLREGESMGMVEAFLRSAAPPMIGLPLDEAREWFETRADPRFLEPLSSGSGFYWEEGPCTITVFSRAGKVNDVSFSCWMKRLTDADQTLSTWLRSLGVERSALKRLPVEDEYDYDGFSDNVWRDRFDVRGKILQDDGRWLVAIHIAEDLPGIVVR